MRVPQVVKFTIESFDLEEKEETYGTCYDYVELREKDGSAITLLVDPIKVNEGDTHL